MCGHRAKRTTETPLAGRARRNRTLDGGAHMKHKIIFALTSLATLVLSAGANFTWR